MTRIVGSIVVKNEVDRYLVPCLEWAQTYLDEIFVYDDRSTDDTAQVAADLGCTVVRRAEHLPSFLDHEGHFRQAAWHALTRKMELDQGDWVFSFDADEFMVSLEGDTRTALTNAVKRAVHKGNGAVELPFPEVFAIGENSTPYVRKDGYWDTIKGTRLFAFQPFGTFKEKSMGCGSEPTYVVRSSVTNQNFGLHVLHYGYAKKEDQQAKFERYTSLMNHGHDNSHVKSIITKPDLVQWEGPIPEVMK